MGKRKRPFSRPRKDGAVKETKASKKAEGAVAAAAKEVPPEEAERREKQRKLREIALRERASGREYKKAKWRHLATVPKTKKEFPVVRDRKGIVPDVVVVPIVWKEKKDECEQITGACKSLNRALKKAGLQCTLDDNNDFMPGTKFKFWEQRGVKLRVELGPRDYRQHLITIATTTVPGRVADKQTIKHITEQQVADHVKRILTSHKESIESEQNKKHVKFD